MYTKEVSNILFVWTKAFSDGNKLLVRLNPPTVRARVQRFEDEVLHAHKKMLSSSDVINGNYFPNAAMKYNDIGVLAIEP